jgi:hypothetical protein
MSVRKAIEATIEWGKLPLEVEEIDPRRLGWRRHPTKPRVWVTDAGELRVFPPDRPELVVRLKARG